MEKKMSMQEAFVTFLNKRKGEVEGDGNANPSQEQQLDVEVEFTEGKKRRRIRTCFLCGAKTPSMSMHVTRKHAYLTLQERHEYREIMLRETPVLMVKNGRNQKSKKLLIKCPLCPAIVQRIDNHIKYVHGKKRGSSIMKALTAKARELEGERLVTGETSHLQRHQKKKITSVSQSAVVIQEQQTLNESEEESPGEERLAKDGIAEAETGQDRMGQDRREEDRMEEDGTKEDIIEEDRIGDERTEENGENKAKGDGMGQDRTEEGRKEEDRARQDRLEENQTGEIGTGEDRMEDEGSFGIEEIEGDDEDHSSQDPQPPVHDVPTEEVQLKERAKTGKHQRIQRVCYLCGDKINRMSMHVMRKHRGLSKRERNEYRQKMLREFPIQHQKNQTRKQKRLFKCPLCPTLAQRIDGHLVFVHGKRRGSYDLKALTAKAKGKPNNSHGEELVRDFVKHLKIMRRRAGLDTVVGEKATSDGKMEDTDADGGKKKEKEGKDGPRETGKQVKRMMKWAGGIHLFSEKDVLTQLAAKLWNMAPETAFGYLTSLKRFVRFLITEEEAGEELTFQSLLKCLYRIEDYMESLAGRIEKRGNIQQCHTCNSLASSSKTTE